MRFFYFIALMTLVHSSAALAIDCRETPWLAGTSSTKTTQRIKRTAETPLQFPVTMKATVFELWLYERREVSWELRHCGGTRFCNVMVERCRLMRDERAVREQSQQVLISLPENLKLTGHQTELFVISFQPTASRKGQALTVDVWSWHHWYRSVRLSANQLDPDQIVTIEME